MTAYGVDQGLLSGTFIEVKQGWPRLVYGWPSGKTERCDPGPFVGVDLNLWPTVYIAVIVMNQTKLCMFGRGR